MGGQSERSSDWRVSVLKDQVNQVGPIEDLVACPDFNQTVPGRLADALFITFTASFRPNAEWLTPVLPGRVQNGDCEGEMCSRRVLEKDT